MNNRIKLTHWFFLMILMLSFASVSVSENPSKTDNKIFSHPYLMKELNNGLKVIIVKTDYPDVVSMQLPVQTGSRNEVEPGKSGFAHFFEHMMFRGSKNYTQAQYGEILKKAGADQNAYTTDDFTNYHVTFTKDDLETMLMLEADRFKNLQFTEAQFRTEALAVKGEYLKNSANPYSKLFEVVRNAAYQQHTYKHTTMGFIEDINEMPNQMDYALTFFDRWYRPEKSALIIVGDIDPDKTFKLVKKYFADWQRGDYQVDIPVEPAAKGHSYKHIKWDSPTLPMFGFSFRGTSADPSVKDKSALDMMGDIYFGSNSDLYQDLVINRQLADSLFFYSPNSKDPGLIYLLARLTKFENYTEVKQAILDTIVEARINTPDIQKLTDLKSASRYGFANHLDNSEAIAAMLASVVQFDRDPELINHRFATLDSIKPEDIKWVANKYLVDDGRIMISLAQEESVDLLSDDFLLADLVAKASVKKKPAFKIADLSNNSDVIDINFLFNTGSANDPAGKKGLAHLTAQMIADGGSATKSYQEIKQIMYPMAAYFNSQIDKEMVSFKGRVHREKAAQWLDVIMDSLLNPGFREDDFKRLKTQQINAIKTDLKGNNDEELGKEVLYQKLYQNHPYNSLNLGSVADIENLALEDVKQFYQDQFVQSNLTLGMIGNLSVELKEKLTANISKKLNVGVANKLIIPKASEVDGRKVTIIQKQTKPTAVSFGFPIAVNRADPDWVALWLVRSYLGEHRNSNSFLYQRIREARGMNYGDYAYIEYFPRGMYRTQPNANLARSEQIFQVWIRPLRSNKDAHFATRVAVYELQHLIKHGLSEQQFKNTKLFLSKYVGLLLKGQDRVLGYHLDSEFYGTTGFVDYVKQGLSELTVEQVNTAIEKHLQYENMHFVFISSDAEDMKSRLVDETVSEMKYNSEKPEDLLKQDEFLQQYPLNIDVENVEIIEVDKMFQ
ncbi:MAG: insulinase family protein [Proteobacteria bacterium]|nr:insulinase family protein [Pseudomonadota bacterium]